MSNRLFQGLIHQMTADIDRTIGIVDESSSIIACSDLGKIGEKDKNITPDTLLTPATFIIDGYTYKSFGNRPRPEYVVFVSGNDEIAQKYATILAVALNGVKQYHDEKYDRTNFMKNVLLDNILPGDIYLKSRELKFEANISKVCLLIKVSPQEDISAYEIIQRLFPEKDKDFVININDNDIALVKDIKEGITQKDIENLAASIIDTLSGEFYIKSVVGIGTVVTAVKDLAKSFKEAQVAIEVGKVFDSDKNIITYTNLGIARLIYQLPTTLCDMFLKEVFRDGAIEVLDQETLLTILKFFENNLNVSETARKLFVHRNTLVYRLEKIKKLTGLDLREFEDAIVFKVALMVRKYLSANPVKY